MDQLSFKVATPQDLAAVNDRYNEIGFLPSHKDELIALASFGERLVGQGRVTTITKESGELGGIYVFAGNEGLGIARKIVSFLIKNSHSPVLYCLPFAELEGFYSSMGFNSVIELTIVPTAVFEKHQWCNKNYDKPVLLLERREHARPLV